MNSATNPEMPNGTSPEELFAQNTLKQCAALLEANKEQQNEQKRIVLKQIANNEPLTALDTLPEEENRLNPAFKRIAEVDEKQFLRERINGKSLDVGSGGKNELEGIVHDVVYTDIMPFPQGSFVQADAKRLPFLDGTFDSVFSQAVANQYEEAKILVPEMIRVANENGVLILHPHEDFLLDNLRVLREQGINLDKQCELTLLPIYRQHDTLPIRFNAPSIYITVRLGEGK